ncbi:MAG: aldo/keto reductase [Ferroplasma sp.]
MEYIKLGYTDLNVSRLCLGGMSFGSSKWMANGDKAEKIIKKAIDVGINFIDTANIYSNGESEKIIGRAINGYRDKLVISTKGGGKISALEQGFSRPVLNHEINKSLENLQTGYVDIYFLHTIFDYVDFDDVATTLSNFISWGKTCYAGLSNFSGSQLAEFYEISNLKHNFKPAILQNHYNAVYREDERDAIPFCNKHKIAYSPFSPIAAGFLSGKYSRNGNNETVRTESYPAMKGRYFKAYDFDVLEAIEELSKQKGAKVSQVALAYILSKGFIPVIGATKPEYIDDDIEALDIKITDDDRRVIEKNYLPHAVINGTAGY